MKRTDAQIYIIAHRPVEYELWDNGLYTPLQVGFNDSFLELRDNTGDNISEWNPLMAEGTGTYWIAANHPQDLRYIGQCQYRRRLEFKEDEDFDEWFKECDVIVAAPLFLVSSTVRQQYEAYHSRNDMDQVEKIINNSYPEYSKSFDRWINNGKFIFYSNGFVMRAQDYDRYCKFLFNICEQLKIMNGWETPEVAKKKIAQEIEGGTRIGVNGHIGDDRKEGYGYQQQVFAFLSERLLTLFILHNFPANRIKCIDYRKYEGV